MLQPSLIALSDLHSYYCSHLQSTRKQCLASVQSSSHMVCASQMITEPAQPPLRLSTSSSRHTAATQWHCTTCPLQWHQPKQHLLPSIACASVQSSSHNGLHTASDRSCAAASAPQHFILTSKSSNPVLRHHLPCHCRGANPNIYCKSMLVLMHKPLSQQPCLGYRTLRCNATDLKVLDGKPSFYFQHVCAPLPCSALSALSSLMKQENLHYPRRGWAAYRGS